MRDNKINVAVIANITARAYSGRIIKIEYTVSREDKPSIDGFDENLLFSSREELIKTL